MFQTADSRGPQGFELVYLGRSRKLNRSEVRTHLRKAGADTSRVVDISFPASGVIGILLHTQYVSEFKSIMSVAQAQIVDDFEPLDPRHLADPKFDSFSHAARSQEMALLVRKRCLATLSFVRPVLVPSIARSFILTGWIDEEDLEEVMDEARARQQKQDPKKAAFVFRSEDPTDNASESGMSI
jgi:hypothetical protein